MDSLLPIGLGLSVDGGDPVLSVAELEQTCTCTLMNTCLCDGFM